MIITNQCPRVDSKTLELGVPKFKSQCLRVGLKILELGVPIGTHQHLFPCFVRRVQTNEVFKLYLFDLHG